MTGARFSFCQTLASRNGCDGPRGACELCGRAVHGQLLCSRSSWPRCSCACSHSRGRRCADGTALADRPGGLGALQHLNPFTNCSCLTILRSQFWLGEAEELFDLGEGLVRASIIDFARALVMVDATDITPHFGYSSLQEVTLQRANCDHALCSALEKLRLQAGCASEKQGSRSSFRQALGCSLCRTWASAQQVKQAVFLIFKTSGSMVGSQVEAERGRQVGWRKIHEEAQLGFEGEERR